MNDGYDAYDVFIDPIDDSVVPNDDLSVNTASIFWNLSTGLRKLT